MDLYVSWPAVSQSESFMYFCSGSFCACCCPALPLGLLFGASLGDCVMGAASPPAGLFILYSRLAGGPTGTIREPNSTPIVTSWWETKRPSQRRMVSYMDCDQRGCWGDRWGCGHTLDLPEPESPMVTILLMKLYGCVGCAMFELLG